MKKSLTQIENQGDLLTLVMRIFERKGMDELTKINEYVFSARYETPFGRNNVKVFCTLSQLGGKVQTALDIIKKAWKMGEEIIVLTSHEKKISDYFKEWIVSELKTDKIRFVDRSELEGDIDSYIPEYWGHNDVFLKHFEDEYIKSIETNGELQQVLKLDKKFEEFLNVYIEPKIFRFKDDIKSGRLLRVRFKREQYQDGNNYFISGDAGTGKSTLLKEIGKQIIESNKSAERIVLPIRIKTAVIAKNDYSVNKAIDDEITRLVGKDQIEKVFKEYDILILIDSIDEFEAEKQKEIFGELNELCADEGINFIIATRNYENLIKGCEVCDHFHTFIVNFDLNQVQQYLNSFFKRDLKKSDELWQSLMENKILERIPSTPLTISLVSVLFEENGYEVPATLTDVYDNFNTFLLGRLNVNSNLDFLKIDVKEKILQMYALLVIRTPNRTRMKYDDFVEYVKKYFAEQSISLEDGVIPELIKSLTDGTGILHVNEQGAITFQHDHFMEYYASREIFNDENRKGIEAELVENFCEYNWQNAAIFYAGRTKNMKGFLGEVVERVKRYNHVHQQLLAVSGMGYLLQSLWMTNSENRKMAVLAALEILLKADAEVKNLAAKDFPFFKGIKDVDIAMANIAWFFFHYNSMTLRDPLSMAFDDLQLTLKARSGTVFEKDRISLLYQMFCIAATLNTGRLKDSQKLELLFNEEGLLTHPLFVFLFDEAANILEYQNETELKNDYRIDSKKRKYKESIRFFLGHSSEELRHTTYEQLMPFRNVELFTEGPTDAIIIDEAFRVLSVNQVPYWNITAIDEVKGSKAGGAYPLANFIKDIAVKMGTGVDADKVVVAIFDNDAKGYQEFNGLPVNFELINGIVKKAKGLEVYAMLLPVPEGEEFEPYHQDKQEFKYFAIEHYFPLSKLRENKMVSEIAIPGVFEITGDKTSFAKRLSRGFAPEDFLNFRFLFEEIDLITGRSINYLS